MEWQNETGTNTFTGYYGFTYRIDFTDGTIYFGKKNFAKTLRYPPLKGKTRVRIVQRESDWRKYEGSCKRRYGRVIQRKTIIGLSKSKGRLTHDENALLYKEKVLTRMDVLNDNISGKIWSKTILAKWSYTDGKN